MGIATKVAIWIVAALLFLIVGYGAMAYRDSSRVKAVRNLWVDKNLELTAYYRTQRPKMPKDKRNDTTYTVNWLVTDPEASRLNQESRALELEHQAIRNRYPWKIDEPLGEGAASGLIRIISDAEIEKAKLEFQFR